MTAKDHNKLLSIFHFIKGGLQALGGIFVTLIYGIMGVIFKANAHRPEEQLLGTVFIVLGFILGPILLALAGINLMAGWKMLKEKAGARNWGIAGAISSLLSFPLGTALGVYGLWFHFGDEGKNFYLGQPQIEPQYFQPPPPNNWQ